LQFIGGAFHICFKINSFSVLNLRGGNALFCEFVCEVDYLVLMFSESLEHGFSNCDMRTATGPPSIVHWYMALIKKLKCKKKINILKTK